MSKILVIEDERDVARVLSKRLIDEGYGVINAFDAYFGLSFVIEQKPDLVILDLMLPAGGGLNVLKGIRGSVKSMNIPVVVLTGIKDENYKQQIIKEGIEAYIQKPYDFEELKKIIKGLIKSEKT